jgi:DNA-binding winged helix-turn-helix (wHTH) protein/tetratricopeptide (TPR) repeat protein
MALRAFPPFKLDDAEHCLWRSGSAGHETRVALKPKSYDLLNYLIDNAGRLVTHQELLEAVWANVFVEREVLKGHIRLLRAALGDDAENPSFVQTVRGRGYRFIGQLSVGTVSTQARGIADHTQQFVARAIPLAELRGLFDKTCKNQPQIVFVVGEPGIGKTALVEEFRRRVSADPQVSAATAQCIEGFGGAEAYYPILEALARRCKDSDGNAVVQQLVSLAPTWAIQLPSLVSAERRQVLQRQIAGAARDRMLREGCELFEALASAKPLILVMEDAHWADYATVDFLAAFARRRSDARMMIVITMRSEEAAIARHPIRELYRELTAHSLCRTVALVPLGPDAIATLLCEPGQDADIALTQLIIEQSGGNPLYVMALLEDLAARGLVRRSGERWILVEPIRSTALEVPVSIQEFVEAGIERLPSTHRAALEAASVEGVIFRTKAVASAAGMDAVAFEEVCEELARRETFIRRAAESDADLRLGGRYAFRHAIHREVFYTRQGPLRRAQSHEKIGTALEHLYAGELKEVALQLEEHFTRAGVWSSALIYTHMALVTAKQRFAYRESQTIFDRARRLIARLPEETRLTTEIRFLEMEASTSAALHGPRAREVYEQMVRQAAAAGLVDAHARALLGLAYTTSWHDHRLSLDIIEEALTLSSRQTDVQLQAGTRIGGYVWRTWLRGWNPEDMRRCDLAVNSLRTTANSQEMAWPLVQYSFIYFLSSRYREARTTLESHFSVLLSIVELHPDLNFARALWMKKSISACSLTLLGEFGAALEEFDAGIEMFTKNGNDYASITLQLYRTWFLLHALDYEAALEAASALSLSSALPAEQRLPLLLMGLAHAALGHKVDATAALLGVERIMDSQPAPQDWYWRLLLEWAFSNLALASDDHGEALRRSDRLVNLTERTDERTWQGIAWETRARVMLRMGRHQEAAACLDRAALSIAGFDAPLAQWRIHSTAAIAKSLAGDGAAAATYAELSRKCRQKLVDSLPPEHRLRTTLLRPSIIEPYLNAHDVDQSASQVR